MKLDILIPLLITTLVAIVSWYIAHSAASKRDRANKKRDLQVQYLIEAYRSLESACVRHDILPRKEDIERAISDIQLFGSPKQVQFAKKVTHDVEQASYTDPRELLADLRKELRSELNLQPLSDTIWHFRVTGNVTDKGQPFAPPDRGQPGTSHPSPRDR